MAKQLVSAVWLKEHLNDDNLIIVDASTNYDPAQTIAGARRFDIKNTFSDINNPLPNSFPSASVFKRECQHLGINASSHIIVYDRKGIFTSPRVWWMFKAFGHKQVSVLNGGFPAWETAGYSVERGSDKPIIQGNFKAQLDSANLKSFEDVKSNINSQDCILIDARSSGRFKGTAPEPRPQLKSGHIKNAINLPYTEVLDNGTYKSVTELKAIFDGLDLGDKSLIFSCGSGITACIILLAYDLVANNPTSVYDGSWTEWATLNSLTY